MTDRPRRATRFRKRIGSFSAVIAPPGDCVSSTSRHFSDDFSLKESDTLLVAGKDEKLEEVGED